MIKKKKIRICFMGGNHAGILGALTALSSGCKILLAVSYSEDLRDILESIGISLCKTINDENFIKKLNDSDLLLSVHGREIVRKELFVLPKYGAVNLHPYLYKYKGADPVGCALRDNNFNASVGAHMMEEKVDTGKVLVEDFVDVSGAVSVEEIYRRLYPQYCLVILKVLDMIKSGKI